MTGRCYIDFETKSFADLTVVGAWEYSLHPTTEVIVLCYRIRHDGQLSEPVQHWVEGPMPPDLSWAIRGNYEVEAHNHSFETAIWTNVMARRHQWPEIMPAQWRDTMAVACYYALPAKLDSLLAGTWP